MKSKTPKQILTLAGIMSFAVAGIFGSTSASALGDFTLPGFEDWQYPWSNRNTSQINYNIIDGAGDGAIAIKKVDENGNPLANAKFKIDGVTALYVNGKYIYSEELGLYSEFTTDKDGLAIVSGLPFGTYKVTETAAPEGYELDPQTYEVVVNEENMTEVEYGRKTWTINMYGLDFTQNIATDPSGQMFYADGDNENMGIGLDLEYSPDEGLYRDEDGHVIARKLDDDRYEISADGWTLRPQKTKTSENLYHALMRFSDETGASVDVYSIKENGDGSILVKFGGEEVICPDGATKDCTIPHSDMYFRKVADSYCAYASYEDEEHSVGLVFEYDPELDAYVFNPAAFAAYLSVKEEDVAYLYLGTALNYYQDIDKYVLISSGTGIFDEAEDITGTVSAVSLTVANASLPSEDGSPEDTPNPQTADAIFRALLALAVAIIFGAVLAKHAGRGRLA